MRTDRAVTRPSSEPVSMRPIVDRQTSVKTLPSLWSVNMDGYPSGKQQRHFEMKKSWWNLNTDDAVCDGECRLPYHGDTADSTVQFHCN